MSLIQSISRCRKPFASGASRNAYYSKRYKVVIKRLRSHPDNFDIRQHNQELEIFNSLTEAERAITPIRQVVRYHDEIVFIMDKVRELRAITNNNYGDLPLNKEDMDRFCHCYGLSCENNETILRIALKYELMDLYFRNVGVDEKNRLVLIDMGI